jgi:hypothetical protein
MKYRRSLIGVAQLAAIVLVGTVTASCGGADASSAPADASPEDFCMTLASLTSDMENGIQESLTSDDGSLPSGEDLADIMQKWSSDMTTVGTPKGIPEEARLGFESWVEEAASTDANDLDPANLKESDLSQEWDDMSAEEFDNSRAFNAYVADTCSDLYRERGML